MAFALSVYCLWLSFMKIYRFCIPVFFALSACSTTKPVYVSEATSFTHGSCNPTPCATIKFETLAALHPAVSARVESAIRDEVDRVLYASVGEEGAELTQERVIADVNSQFDDYLATSDAGASAEWSLERSATVLFTSSALTSVAVKSSGYLGGAHGFRDETYLVFDSTSGERLGWDDVIAAGSKKTLFTIAEAEFRRARSLASDVSLKDEGFEFPEGEEFSLPKNFALTDKGLVLVYNPYEVAPYVMGPTSFTIPLDVIGVLLRTDRESLQELFTERPVEGMVATGRN